MSYEENEGNGFACFVTSTSANLMWQVARLTFVIHSDCVVHLQKACWEV